jgi:hypothetical protein
MHASKRGGSSFALESLEGRELLSFDPSKTGAVHPGSHSWKSFAGADSYFIENERIGYMIASFGDVLPDTSYGKGGDPWAYVPGGRLSFKNGAVPIGTLTVRNVQSTHVTVERYWAEDWDELGTRTGQKGKWNGVHTDGIYIENAKGLNPQSVFVFEDVEMTEISGGQGVLWEKGSAKRVHFKSVHIENRKTSISGRLMMKVDEQTRIEEIVFDDVTANVIFLVEGVSLADALGTVYVHNLAPSQLESLRAMLDRNGFPVNDPTRFVASLPDDLVDGQGVALPRPYRGTPAAIEWTTTIPAEDYDNGQEGMAYHDTTADTGGGGGGYRTSAKRNPDAVDIIESDDDRLVWMEAGEWIDYTVDVRIGGVYEVRALTAGGGVYRMEFDGLRSTGNLNDGTGGRVYLTQGVHVMRLVAIDGAFAVDGISLARTNDQVTLDAAPKGLKATTLGWGALDTGPDKTRTFASATNLSWQDVDGEREYLIDRRTEDGKWTRIGATAADVTSMSDAGLWEQDGEQSGIQPGVVYYYRVIAVGDGSEAYFVSEQIRVSTPDPTLSSAPKAPRWLTARVVSSGTVTLRWEHYSVDERGFRIERSTDPSFREFDESEDGVHLSYDLRPVGAGARKYRDLGGKVTDRVENQSYRLRPGQTYYYRVTAYNSYGHSAASEVVSVTIPAKVLAPAAARNVTVASHDSGCGAVVVSWERPAAGKEGGFGGVVGGYRVERRREAATSSWHVLGIVGGNTTRFVDAALRTSNRIAYQYRVVAFNVAGEAETAEVRTLQTPKAEAVVSAPRSLAATSFSRTAIKLTWEDSSSNETGFRVERSNDGFTWLIIGGTAADDASYKDEGLVSDVRYYYRVTAFNTNDTEPAIGTSVIVRGATLPPNIPGGIC